MCSRGEVRAAAAAWRAPPALTDALRIELLCAMKIAKNHDSFSLPVPDGWKAEEFLEAVLHDMGRDFGGSLTASGRVQIGRNPRGTYSIFPDA